MTALCQLENFSDGSPDFVLAARPVDLRHTHRPTPNNNPTARGLASRLGALRRQNKTIRTCSQGVLMAPLP